MLETAIPWLENATISQASEDALTAQIIESLNTPNLTPLQRYAVARFMLNAMERVAEYEGAAAVQYCHESVTGLDGKQFRHSGLDFLLHITKDFNYRENDDTGEFAMMTQKIQLNRRENTILTNQLKNIKANILLKHPQMKPKLVKETITLRYE